jgi:hypothetical protein
MENPWFLFLEGPVDADVTPVAATVALPDTSAARASATTARAASSTNRLVVGASAPTRGACSSTSPAALGDRGRGFHLSGGARPHRSPLLPRPPPTTNSPGSPGERAPAARAAGTPHSVAPGAPVAGCSSPSGVRPAPAPVAVRRGRPLGPGAWAGQTVRRPRSLSAEK